MSPSASVLRIGTRGSPLARWQAGWVADQLQAAGIEVELVPIVTTGDVQTGSIEALGGIGVFTKELQRALLDERIDLAVHSLKDLPTIVVPGLKLAAVPPREATDDVLISASGLGLDELPPGARIGTGSMRRRSQLLHHRSDLAMFDIRGNVDTRLRKLHDGEFDALVLAQAGLSRLGLEEHITQVIPSDIMLPAVGQGALGLETRERDPVALAAVATLDHPASHAAVVAERAMLATLLGGCLAPVAGWGRVEPDGLLMLTGSVLSADGGQRLLAEHRGPVNRPQELGQAVAEALLAQGAAELIARSRRY